MIPIMTYNDEMNKLRKRKNRPRIKGYYVTDIAQPLPVDGKVNPDGSSTIFTNKSGLASGDMMASSASEGLLRIYEDKSMSDYEYMKSLINDDIIPGIEKAVSLKVDNPCKDASDKVSNYDREAETIKVANVYRADTNEDIFKMDNDELNDLLPKINYENISTNGHYVVKYHGKIYDFTAWQYDNRLDNKFTRNNMPVELVKINDGIYSSDREYKLHIKE